MTSIETTTKTYYHLRTLVALAVAASLLVMLAAKPAHASTTFTVDTEQDSGDANPGDGVCNTNLDSSQRPLCPLRAAIDEANALPGADVINFKINNPEKVGFFQPHSQLPTITDRVTIDGYSQPGSKPNALEEGTDADIRIWLFGNSAGSVANGLKIGAGGSGSVIRGLVINNFSNDGVFIDRGSTQNRIEGNFIGADPGGTLDAGNSHSGVNVFGASSNTIGGDTPAARNLISGNGLDGVSLSGFLNDPPQNNTVQGNLIGTQKDGTSALGNDSRGVFVINSSDNGLSLNTIAFNGAAGVAIASTGTTKGDLLAANSIFSNVGLGIDLNDDGVTANDDKDPDSGPNDLQNFPVLSSAKTSKKGTTIAGTLNSTPNKFFVVQFFSNASGGDEGQKFIGQTGVTTDGSGNASFTFSPTEKVPRGQKITATAIQTVGEKNTSEFSKAKKVARKR